jgi:RNA polymerase sporulation-specific sigma factor
MYRRNLDSDGVFSILAQKYRSLICRVIFDFNRQSRLEEFVNEGLYVLLKCLWDFDESRNKTFTRFFEERLKWHFISIIKDERMYVVSDVASNIEMIEPQHDTLEIPPYLIQSEVEVFELLYISKKSIKEASQILGRSAKSIYNIVYSIKKKVLQNQ